MWTGDFIFGCVLVGIALLVAVVAGLIGALSKSCGAMVTAVVALVIAIGLALLTGMPWPFDAAYHQYERVEGPVQTIDSRLMAEGEGMEERFIISFEGTGNDYRCDDSRCASVKPGDTLVLNCLRKWEFRASDGYQCNFVDWIPAGGGD